MTILTFIPADDIERVHRSPLIPNTTITAVHMTLRATITQFDVLIKRAETPAERTLLCRIARALHDTSDHTVVTANEIIEEHETQPSLAV